MKKIILLTLLLFGVLLSNNVFADSNDTYFIVTAYYSPLPNQEHYSYSVYTNRERTYEEEKRLQGEGLRGASGKKVFSGMLAAPKNYKFGTKIYLDGLGVGEVSDRGGAIVNKGIRGHGYDRIDVWMGYGDEGLRRATYWGKRKVKGKFLSKNTKINLDYNVVLSPKWVIKTQAVKKEVKDKEIDIFSKKLTTKDQFIKLQKVLTEMNLYSGAIDGNYKSIVDVIYDFQVKKNIVKGVYSPGAGSYGPITRDALNKEYTLLLQRKEEERLELVRIEKEKEKERARIKELKDRYNQYNELAFSKANLKIQNIGTPKFGDISHGVRSLQLVLKEFGYFNYKDTAIYGNITKKSIIAYQLDKKIIKSKNDLGAGIFGPKTKKALKDDLKKYIFKQIVEKENFNLEELALLDGDKI